MRTRTRRVVSAIAATAAAIVGVELVALGVHRVMLGRSFSRRAFADARARARQAPRPRATSVERAPHVAEDVVHPYLGFTGNPTANAGFSNLGFWGKLGWPPPRRDAARVLVGMVGGSFAADVYDQAGEHLAARLGTLPRFAGREIVLLNMAYGGWKQPQQLAALAWLIAIGGELDVLIDVDGFNEVALDSAENDPRGVFPPYPRAWAMRVGEWTDPNQLAILAAAARRAEDRERAAALFDRRPLRWSPTAALAWSAIDRRLAAHAASAEVDLSRTSAHDTFRELGVTPAAHLTPAERLDLLVATWRRSSLALARLAAAHGIEYWQFLQPNQYDEGAKPMTDGEQRVAFRENHPYRPGARAGYPLLRRAGETLRAEGVAFVDLSRMFSSERAPMFSDDCCHLTTAGYVRFTDAAADAIARSDR